MFSGGLEGETSSREKPNPNNAGLAGRQVSASHARSPRGLVFEGMLEHLNVETPDAPDPESSWATLLLEHSIQRKTMNAEDFRRLDETNDFALLGRTSTSRNDAL